MVSIIHLWQFEVDHAGVPLGIIAMSKLREGDTDTGLNTPVRSSGVGHQSSIVWLCESLIIALDAAPPTALFLWAEVIQH